MSRSFFPGGNTPGGFFSYFGEIAREGERTLCLKGASGSGKATFMKKAAAAFAARGCPVEYFWCSNDPASLDGIRVPGARTCIVDGTAPHVQDPALPVARDMLFDMAAFIDPAAVQPHREELARLSRTKKECCARAYAYLAAAWALHQDSARLRGQFLDRGKLNACILEALGLFDGTGSPGKTGHTRRFFADALTPEGFVNTLDSLTDLDTVVVLRGEPGMGTDAFLEHMQRAAGLRGLDTERLCRPLDPGAPEHLIVPELRLGFFTQNRLCRARFPAHAREIQFSDFIHGLETHSGALNYNEAMFDLLTGKAVQTLAAQRAAHGRMEEIYIEGMDFDGLNRACEEMIARLVAGL